jgi:phosphate acetyltransferase
MNLRSTLFIAPSGANVGLTSIALGLVRALDSRGMRVGFFKPIGQPTGYDTGPERSTHFVRQTTSLQPTEPIPLDTAERLLLAGHGDELSSRVMEKFHESAPEADVVVVEGLT